jgi:hypothetical protein
VRSRSAALEASSTVWRPHREEMLLKVLKFIALVWLGVLVTSMVIIAVYALNTAVHALWNRLARTWRH